MADTVEWEVVEVGDHAILEHGTTIVSGKVIDVLMYPARIVIENIGPFTKDEWAVTMVISGRALDAVDAPG